MPNNGEKRWVRTKGSKNAAKMWREDMQMWVIVPMVPGKEFKYTTPKQEIKPVRLRKIKHAYIIKNGYKK